MAIPQQVLLVYDWDQRSKVSAGVVRRAAKHRRDQSLLHAKGHECGSELSEKPFSARLYQALKTDHGYLAEGRSRPKDSRQKDRLQWRPMFRPPDCLRIGRPLR